MTTTRFITISGALVILYISALIIGGFNPYHWFATIPLIAIGVMLFMKLNNDARRNALKAFRAEIEKHSEDIKWLQDKKADLKISTINKRLGASKIEMLDQAIESLLHVTENETNINSLKEFRAEIEEHSEDMKWLQDKKADLKISTINKLLNASMIEMLDQAIESLLHVTENDANLNALKEFRAEIEEHSEDIKWLQDKKADLKISTINKLLNASMIEEIDQAIENLLHVAEEEDIVIEEPNPTTEESDQVIEEIPSEPEQEVEKFEPISTPISDADLLRVAYTLWRVHDAADGGKTQKDFITKFLKTFGAEYNFHDKLSKSFDVKNETILDKMVEVFEKEKEKRAQKS